MDSVENKVTVIIPSRKIDFLLEKCVKEIRNLYSDIPIVLILDEFEENNIYKNDTNILILKSENRNISSKRNLGVKHSKTEYIAFIDSDAYPSKGVEKAVDFLDKNQNYSAVTGLWYNPPEDTLEQNCLRLVRFSKLFTHKEWCILIDTNAVEQDCTMAATSNLIIRKNVYEDVGGMNENQYLAEDNDFSVKLEKKGYKIRFIPEMGIYHRESTMLPYFKKIYCMSYYYSNMFIKGKSVKSLPQMISHYLPLLGIIIYIFLWILCCLMNINTYFLLFLPLLIFFILISEAVCTSKKLERNKLKGFFMILFDFCIFIAVWVIGTILGTINFPTKDIRNFYRQY